jgi:hypothetical protein
MPITRPIPSTLHSGTTRDIPPIHSPIARLSQSTQQARFSLSCPAALQPRLPRPLQASQTRRTTRVNALSLQASTLVFRSNHAPPPYPTPPEAAPHFVPHYVPTYPPQEGCGQILRVSLGGDNPIPWDVAEGRPGKFPRPSRGPGANRTCLIGRRRSDGYSVGTEDTGKHPLGHQPGTGTNIGTLILAEPAAPCGLCLPAVLHPRFHLSSCLLAPQSIERLGDRVAQLAAAVEVEALGGYISGLVGL